MGIQKALRLTYLKMNAGSSSVTRALLQQPSYRPEWPISSTEGRKIIKRHFNFCGQSYEMAGQIRWHIRDLGIDWHREFFSYHWLQDVASISSEKAASSFAREFINGFTLISKIDDVHPCAWELEVVGQRLTHWLYYCHFVLKGGSSKFFSRYQKSLVQHMVMLYDYATSSPELLGPNAVKGLIAATTIMPHCGFILDDALEVLDELIQRDVLPDGGHISQSPNHHLSFLKTLIEIRGLLEAKQISFSPLDEAIPLMGSMLRFFCHGDGRLALFNQNLMEDMHVIERAVTLAGDDITSSIYAEHSGYAKLQAAGSCCFMRMGTKDSQEAPLGISAIEFSDQSERIFVNCGMYYGDSKEWRDALSHPSAFSTLSPDENRALEQHGAIIREVEEKSSRHAIALRYAIYPDIEHERTIELDHDGGFCKGKDMLYFNSPEASLSDIPKITARFHLHPDIRCQSRKEGGYVLKSVSGTEWLFSCSLPKYAHVEESVYLGYYGKPQKTLQLAITIPENELKSGLRWELKKQG